MIFSSSFYTGVLNVWHFLLRHNSHTIQLTNCTDCWFLVYSQDCATSLLCELGQGVWALGTFQSLANASRSQPLPPGAQTSPAVRQVLLPSTVLVALGDLHAHGAWVRDLSIVGLARPPGTPPQDRSCLGPRSISGEKPLEHLSKEPLQGQPGPDRVGWGLMLSRRLLQGTSSL